jgi:lipopolysaccharide/colanic/teichoic acid biosynthesis glycosyltransferase
VGLNGRKFVLYKFRTMKEGAEARQTELLSRNEMSGPAFKIKDDPRVTPIGVLLRKFSIDEFPQFWNVLKGDMSIVGPRPPIQSEVLKYDNWQRRRLSMRPGMTCLWQVEGRNRITDFDEWMRLDLEYIDNWSIWLDIRIFLRTIPAVLCGRGAT